MSPSVHDPKTKARAAWKRALERIEPRHNVVPGLAGDGAGHVKCFATGHYYWVRLLGVLDNIVRAVCYDFVPADGMAVLVEKEQRKGQDHYRIIRRATVEDLGGTDGWFDTTVGSSQGSPAPAHHTVHESGGSDLLNVDSYMLSNLRAIPSAPHSMKVTVGAGYVNFGGVTSKFPQTDSPTMVAPSYGQQYALVSLDSALTLKVTYGVQSFGTPVRPALVDGELPIAYVHLIAGMTAIDNSRIYDARPIFTICTPAATVVTSDPGDHVHAINEDHSLECNGVKTVFVTAQEWEPESLEVFYNGHLLRIGLGLDFEEGAQHDAFELGIAPPDAPDTLIVSYLAVLV